MGQLLLLAAAFGPALLLAASPAAVTKQNGEIDFQRQIRPILSDNCFKCHGPDPQTRLAGLRLDVREAAFSERKAGRVIVPGDPNASLVYQRITHPKDSMRMPPLQSHRKLTDEQKELIRKWIAQGASWKEHWAFTPPARPAPPRVSNAAWPKTPIDRFILGRLEAAHLAPAPAANRRALIRRVSLDLTGLPPRSAEVEAFVQDLKPGAYERVVDRLLASPQYGEHRARYWLDAARYADTHGIHMDNYREMWPYRDWVIAAFNRNMPFDQFTVEQLAGDLLPERTTSQQIASGFHRCNATTNEGGSIPEEVEAIYAKDRVETTSTVWLGLTAGCASCHDHKFDPIAQKEFYQLAAFFRNNLQKPMDGNRPDTPPVLVLPRAEDEKRWKETESELDRLAEVRRKHREDASPRVAAWLADMQGKRPSEAIENQDERLAVDAAENAPAVRIKGEVKAASVQNDVKTGEGPFNAHPALRFGEKSWVEFPGVDLEADQSFSFAAWVYLPASEDNFNVASQMVLVTERAPDDDDEEERYQGWSIDINARTPSLVLSGPGPGPIRVSGSSFDRLKPGSWNHLVFTYDGSRDQRGLALYVNGKRSITEGGALEELKGSIRTSAPIRLGNRGKSYFDGGGIADFRLYGRALREEEAQVLANWPAIQGALEKDPAQLSDEERASLTLFYANRYDPAYRKLQEQADSLEAERFAIRRRAAVTLVMEEKNDVTPTAQILNRGQYDQPRGTVQANVPAVLPPMAESLPRNRLGLAKWLVDPANPLTARVTVNRFWQEIFGIGLVKTAEDFGSQGEAPSHPELLDWLAVEFRESGWDVKKLIRLMVTSAAYRQSAATTEQKIAADPDNRLLSRGPRFRMDAEMVRDLALASSGLLVSAVGGPSVKPYQPDGIWETVAMKGSNTRFYKQEHGDRLYRRSLYTFWKRSAPPPSMEIFNATTRESCIVRRERTNTPLQALVTMNDPQFVEASRRLAERALSAGPTFDRRVDNLTESVLSRPLKPAERLIVRRELRDLLAMYKSEPEQAKKLITVGESKPQGQAPAPEFAAWTMVASQILNLDEALNK
jgi:hypothetical protein